MFFEKETGHFINLAQIVMTWPPGTYRTENGTNEITRCQLTHGVVIHITSNELERWTGAMRELYCQGGDPR